MSFRIIALSCILLLPGVCRGQVDDDTLIEQIMEYIAENVSEDQDYSEITERLNNYRKYPMDINKVQNEHLKELVFISPLQINSLILYRQESGPFQELLELQSIEGFDNETVRWLTNFVTVIPPLLLSDISITKLVNNSNHDLMFRFGRILERQKGFLPSDSGSSVYAGSPYRILTRYRFNFINKISISLNMDKDAGEVFFKNSGKGFDFYSANISLKGERFVKKLVVGDYALQFGQGLTMWSGLGFGKAAGLTTAAKQAWGLRPYSSFNESSFLRGTSATFNHQGISLTPFISYKKIDANLSSDNSEINSLPLSGLHRTMSERSNKNSAQQLVYGINSSYSQGDFAAGFTAYTTQINKPFAAGKSMYERFDFRSKSLTNVGFNYAYTFRNTYFFGEGAHSISSGLAYLSGLMSSLSSQVSGVLLYRNYASNYHSFFNQGLSESTDAKNEKGFYSAINVKFNPRFELTSYFDYFRFPWLKFRVDAPSQGHEIFAQLTYSLNKQFKITGRFKLQEKEENSSNGNITGGLENVEKQSYRVELYYKASKSFTLRNRAEVSIYKKGQSAGEFGFLSYQDVIYNPLSSKFSGNMRFAIFDTDGFSSRIYAYENDVLYSYSVPAYQGRGLRCYLNARYTPRRGLDLWARYALLSYSDQETVGSGNDMISGNRRSDIKLQLRFQF